MRVFTRLTLLGHQSRHAAPVSLIPDALTDAMNACGVDRLAFWSQSLGVGDQAHRADGALDGASSVRPVKTRMLAAFRGRQRAPGRGCRLDHPEPSPATRSCRSAGPIPRNLCHLGRVPVMAETRLINFHSVGHLGPHFVRRNSRFRHYPGVRQPAASQQAVFGVSAPLPVSVVLRDLSCASPSSTQVSPRP